MTKEEYALTKKCGNCRLLDEMNTRLGKKYCCKYFDPPEEIENVGREQYRFGGFGATICEPYIKTIKIKED